MRDNHFGSTMRALRKARNMMQSELAAELGVSVTTISRYESGKRKPSYSQYQLLMQTLGEYSGDYVTVFMSKDEIEQYKLLSKLRCAIRDGRLGEAKELLQEADLDDEKIEDELLQFCIYAKVMLADDITSEDAIEQLMRALAINKKPLPLPNVANITLRYNDIIILGELANRHAQKGDIDFAIELLTAVKNSMDSFYTDEREKSVTYPILLCNLSTFHGRKGNHDMALSLCGTAIKAALQFNNLRIMPSLIYNLASAKYFIGDKDGSRRALTEAYYTAKAMQFFDVAEAAKKDATEAFGVEFE